MIIKQFKMQYNFKVRTALTDEESQALVSEVVEGLEASSQLILEVKVRVNTELPDDKADSLKEAVNTFVSERLGVEAETELISKEY